MTQSTQSGSTRLFWTCLVALVCLLGASAPAHAWSIPQFLSDRGGADFGPGVALDADADSLVVWHHYKSSVNQIRGRSLSAAGVLGPLQKISPAPRQTAVGPEVAGDADGDAIVVWTRIDEPDRRIVMRTVSSTGVMGSPRPLSWAGQDAIDPQIASDANGNAVVVWRRFDGLHWRVQARPVSTAGVVGPVRTLSSSSSGRDAGGPRVDLGAAGNAVVVWRQYDAAYSAIHARSISAAGALGPIKILNHPLGAVDDGPQVAVADDGDAIVAWSPGRARRLTASGHLGPVLDLADGSDVQITGDSEGNAVAAWLNDGGINRRIQARTISSSDVLGSTQTLWTATYAVDPRLASDNSGGATVLWRVAPDGGQHVVLYANTISVDGIVGSEQTLAGPSSGNWHIPFTPALASSTNGTAVAAWPEREGRPTQLRASIGP